MAQTDNSKKSKAGYLDVLSDMENHAGALARSKHALDGGLSKSGDNEYKGYQDMSRALGEAVDNLRLALSRAKSKIQG